MYVIKSKNFYYYVQIFSSKMFNCEEIVLLEI